MPDYDIEETLQKLISLSLQKKLITEKDFGKYKEYTINNGSNKKYKIAKETSNKKYDKLNRFSEFVDELLALIFRDYSCLVVKNSIPISNFKPVYPPVEDGFLVELLPNKKVLSSNSTEFIRTVGEYEVNAMIRYSEELDSSSPQQDRKSPPVRYVIDSFSAKCTYTNKKEEWTFNTEKYFQIRQQEDVNGDDRIVDENAQETIKKLIEEISKTTAKKKIIEQLYHNGNECKKLLEEVIQNSKEKKNGHIAIFPLNIFVKYTAKQKYIWKISSYNINKNIEKTIDMTSEFNQKNDKSNLNYTPWSNFKIKDDVNTGGVKILDSNGEGISLNDAKFVIAKKNKNDIVGVLSINKPLSGIKNYAVPVGLGKNKEWCLLQGVEVVDEAAYGENKYRYKEDVGKCEITGKTFSKDDLIQKQPIVTFNDKLNKSDLSIKTFLDTNKLSSKKYGIEIYNCLHCGTKIALKSGQKEFYLKKYGLYDGKSGRDDNATGIKQDFCCEACLLNTKLTLSKIKYKDEPKEIILKYNFNLIKGDHKNFYIDKVSRDSTGNLHFEDSNRVVIYGKKLYIITEQEYKIVNKSPEKFPICLCCGNIILGSLHKPICDLCYSNEKILSNRDIYNKIKYNLSLLDRLKYREEISYNIINNDLYLFVKRKDIIYRIYKFSISTKGKKKRYYFEKIIN